MASFTPLHSQNHAAEAFTLYARFEEIVEDWKIQSDVGERVLVQLGSMLPLIENINTAFQLYSSTTGTANEKMPYSTLANKVEDQFSIFSKCIYNLKVYVVEMEDVIKELSELLEIIVKLRLEIQLYIPKHPFDNYSFEKNILKPGQYLLCHKGIVVNKVEVQQDTECPICYNELETKNIFITKCNHKFCGDCIFKHFQKDNGEFCPLCRGVYADKCIHKKRNRIRRIIYDETEEDNEELIVNTDSRDIQRDNINDNVTINRGNVYNFTNTTIDMDMDFMSDFNYSNQNNEYSYITPPHIPQTEYEVSNINLSENTLSLQRQQAMNQYGVIEQDQISNILPSFTPQALDTDMLIVSNENSMVYNEVYDEETISIVDSIGDNSM